jgi:hypothetical protein
VTQKSPNEKFCWKTYIFINKFSNQKILIILIFVQPKHSRYSCHPNSQIVVFERQTTTSDENNAEYYSCCYEDSFYQQQQCDNEANGDTSDTINTPNTVIAQTHSTTSNSVQTTSQPQKRSSSPQVK